MCILALVARDFCAGRPGERSWAKSRPTTADARKQQTERHPTSGSAGCRQSGHGGRRHGCQRRKDGSRLSAVQPLLKEVRPRRRQTCRRRRVIERHLQCVIRCHVVNCNDNVNENENNFTQQSYHCHVSHIKLTHTIYFPRYEKSTRRQAAVAL